MGQAAATYTPQMAVTLVRKFARDAPTSDLDANVCDIVNSTIWMAFPWTWAQASLTAISLTNGVQDFAVDATNNNIHRILRVRITRTDTTPDQYNDKITLRDSLPPDLTKAGMWGIQSASYDGINDKIRLERAISIGSGETLTLNGEYWKKPTKITDDIMDSVLLIPDRHFGVFVEGVKWKFFQFINDNRAGTIQTDRSGRRTYTGQLGIFREALYDMAMSEDYGDEAAVYPDTPFGAREPMPGLF